MSGISVTTAVSLWGRYEPEEIQQPLAESCCRQGIVEGVVSVDEAERFIERRYSA